MLRQDQVYQAWDRNMLVFDVDSEGAILTTRLMKLMAEVSGYNQIIIDTIYVPDVECKMVEGWEIVRDSRLNIGGEFYQYLSGLGNMLRPNLPNIVIATGPRDALLGNC